MTTPKPTKTWEVVQVDPTTQDDLDRIHPHTVVMPLFMVFELFSDKLVDRPHGIRLSA
jgi:hypothetical protein